jgi:hypothetical protein
MVNNPKRKGTIGESAIVKALIEAGWPHAERRALHGSTDKGDITLGVPGVMIEGKNCITTEIPAWLREVAAQTANANAEIGVVWHKIRGKADARDWAVTMSGAQFIAILRMLGYHPETQPDGDAQ